LGDIIILLTRTTARACSACEHASRGSAKPQDHHQHAESKHVPLCQADTLAGKQGSSAKRDASSFSLWQCLLLGAYIRVVFWNKVPPEICL